MVSIIIPAYNEQENIENTAAVIGGILDKTGESYELLFVDDGSQDSTWDKIEALTKTHGSVRGIKFARNFGKEGAIFAGLRNCFGDCAIVIDCDLQHPPELIPQMLELHRQGFEVVEAVKASRGKEGFVYKFFAKTFYRIMRSSSSVDLDGASDYKLMDRKVIDALKELPERITFFRALSSWVGFRTAKIEFNVAPRMAGKSKWSFKKLAIFAINNITSFTNLPMQLVTGMGLLFLLFAFGIGIQSLVNYFSGTAQEGFTTVYMLVLFAGSLIMIGLGIIGYYLSKIYEEVKQRPRYIISIDTKNRKEQDNTNDRNL